MPRSQNRRGRFIRTIEQAVLDRETAELYVRLGSYNEVARHQNIDASTAIERVRRAFADVQTDDVVLAKKVLIDRLMSEFRMADSIAHETHYAHSNGRLIYITDQVSGELVPLIDRSVNLAALDRCKAIDQELSKLLGLYAPQTVRLEVIPADVIQELVSQNERRILELESALNSPPESIETTAKELNQHVDA